MRFHYGAVPEDIQFKPEIEGWHDIHEPNPIMINLLALPVMVVLLLFWGLLLLINYLINPFTFHILTIDNIIMTCVGWFGVIIILIPLHEIIHALVHPGWGLSSKTIIGLWLSKGLFYAHYDGNMTRNRFLLVFIAPYLFLGILPILLINIFPEATVGLIIISFWGSLLACGDFVGIGFILFQIPKLSIVHNKGWKTYWKSI